MAAAKVLTWAAWSQVHQTIPVVGKPPNTKRLGERWHLFKVHDDFLPKIALLLAEHCFDKTAIPVRVFVNSYWVDVYPRARWGPSFIEKAELGDLLADVRVKYQGKPAFRKAVLLQGKWSKAWNELDSGSCNPGADDATNRERDLLEGNTGLVMLELPSSPLINGSASNPVFDLAKDKYTNRLMGHSKYFLFLDAPSAPTTPGIEPYVCLVPTNRLSQAGAVERYEDMLCDLCLPPNYGQTTVVPNMETTPEWRGLVNRIGAWATAKPDSSRFGGLPYQRVEGAFCRMEMVDYTSPSNYISRGNRGARYYYRHPFRSRAEGINFEDVTPRLLDEWPGFIYLDIIVDFATPPRDMG